MGGSLANGGGGIFPNSSRHGTRLEVIRPCATGGGGAVHNVKLRTPHFRYDEVSARDVYTAYGSYISMFRNGLLVSSLQEFFFLDFVFWWNSVCIVRSH